MHLLGRWQARIESQAQPVAVLLEKSPEFSEGVAGQAERPGQRTWLAGDVDDDLVQLEESEDGVHISATWSGHFSAGSCAHEITGTWQAAGSSQEHRFVLRKLAP